MKLVLSVSVTLLLAIAQAPAYGGTWRQAKKLTKALRKNDNGRVASAKLNLKKAITDRKQSGKMLRSVVIGRGRGKQAIPKLGELRSQLNAAPQALGQLLAPGGLSRAVGMMEAGTLPADQAALLRVAGAMGGISARRIGSAVTGIGLRKESQVARDKAVLQIAGEAQRDPRVMNSLLKRSRLTGRYKYGKLLRSARVSVENLEQMRAEQKTGTLRDPVLRGFEIVRPDVGTDIRVAAKAAAEQAQTTGREVIFASSTGVQIFARNGQAEPLSRIRMIASTAEVSPLDLRVINRETETMATFVNGLAVESVQAPFVRQMAMPGEPMFTLPDNASGQQIAAGIGWARNVAQKNPSVSVSWVKDNVRYTAKIEPRLAREINLFADVLGQR